MSVIQKKLIEKGIPTPSDLRKFSGIVKQSEYGKWNRSTIASVLRNQTYAGVWHYGKQKVFRCTKEDGSKGHKKTKNPASYQIEVNVPPIIAQDVFDLVQEKLAENKQRRGQPGAGEILLRKRCTCGECDYKVGATGRERYHYYTCGVKFNNDCLKTCTQKAFKTDLVDCKVWGWVESILTDRERLEAELDNVEAKQGKNSAMLESQLEAAELKITELKQELAEMLGVLIDLKRGGKAYAAILVDIDRVE